MMTTASRVKSPMAVTASCSNKPTFRLSAADFIEILETEQLIHTQACHHLVTYATCLAVLALLPSQYGTHSLLALALCSSHIGLATLKYFPSSSWNPLFRSGLKYPLAAHKVPQIRPLVNIVHYTGYYLHAYLLTTLWHAFILFSVFSVSYF